MLEYQQLCGSYAQPDARDAWLGRQIRSAFFRVFAPTCLRSGDKVMDDDIGPVGFVVVLLLGVTLLGHVCTPGGRYFMYAVLLRYIAFLKVLTIPTRTHSPLETLSENHSRDKIHSAVSHFLRQFSLPPQS